MIWYSLITSARNAEKQHNLQVCKKVQKADYKIYNIRPTYGNAIAQNTSLRSRGRMHMTL